MFYGFINSSVALPQLAPEDLSDPAFLRPFSLVPQKEQPRVFVRDKGRTEPLFHFAKDEEALSAIDALCPDLQSLDHMLNRLFAACRPGDVVFTSSLLNFSRYLDQALKVTRFFYEKQVRVVALLEDFDSFQEVSFLTSNVYIKYQENRSKEVANRRRCQAASKTGTKSGRKALALEDFPSFPGLYERWKAKLITKKVFADQLAISRPTLNRLIRLFEDGEKN